MGSLLKCRLFIDYSLESLFHYSCLSKQVGSLLRALMCLNFPCTYVTFQLASDHRECLLELYFLGCSRLFS